MHSSPEVAAREALERSRVSVKITGNMIELTSPTASAATPAPAPGVRRTRQAQHGGDCGGQPQQVAGAHARQQRAAHEAPHHRAQPVEAHELARLLERDREDVRLVQEVSHEAADRDFRAHVQEDAGRAEQRPA